ncbi:MAG TPA: hypothetical protein VME22_33770 [Solirubrobacteraceae bacterium]|nr:hypothetical protein [Solirubrobacteraceae bacterium]
MSELVFDQKIDLPYAYTAGAVQREALTGLREGRVIASEGDGYVSVPASPFAPDGTHLRETRELVPEGVIEASTLAHHLPGTPAFALIRLDGASHALLHHLGDGAEILGPGARVRAVWREGRTGAITDILHFAPAPETVR